MQFVEVMLNATDIRVRVEAFWNSLAANGITVVVALAEYQGNGTGQQLFAGRGCGMGKRGVVGREC